MLDEVELTAVSSAEPRTASIEEVCPPLHSTYSTDQPSSPPPPPPPPPYSSFASSQKWAIVLLATCAGLFSNLGANIYFPAIPTLARAFGESTQSINLTVTIYMVFQGVTPSVWGTFADSYGRRPIYILCLLLFVLAQIGLAVIPTSSYAALMVLRCVSAAGSASLIPLGAGTVGDIAEPAERGRYMGLVQMGPMLGPCIGPAFGGLLNQQWGWRAIFWFLVITSTPLLMIFILSFPETLRTIVGNGSIRAHGVSQTLWSLLRRSRRTVGERDPSLSSREVALERDINPLLALRAFLEKDVAIVLFYNAFNFTTFYALSASLSSVLEDHYGLSTSITGICYLAIGSGAFVATFTSGRLLDLDFRRTRERIERQRLAGSDIEDVYKPEKVDQAKIDEIVARNVKTFLDPNKLLDFPLEETRLKHMPYYSMTFWASTIVNGWVMQVHGPLAVALLLQFLVGWSVISIMQVNQVLLVDLYPGRGASITASNNLCRCLLGALGTAVVDPLKNAIGLGCTMTIFGILPALMVPVMILERSRGMQWRRERAERARVVDLDE